MKQTRFFVEDILRPDFGSGQINHETPESPGSTPSATEERHTDTPGVGDGEDKANLWPAWVYCTRYSDRPSSGENNTETNLHSPYMYTYRYDTIGLH